MYEEHVLQHFSEPYHKGPFPDGPGTIYNGASTSVVCGDDVHVQAHIEDGVITKLWWQGEGCCFAQAAASMLAKYADGRTVDAMREFREDEMFDLFKVACPDVRKSCVLVSLNALQTLLETYS